MIPAREGEEREKMILAREGEEGEDDTSPRR